jgi:uncharacterized protein
MAADAETPASHPGAPQSPFQSGLQALLRQNARPEEKFGHQPRLYALTRLVGNGSDYDDDIVCAAAYLHDIGVFTGHRPEDHALLAAWDHVRYAVEKSPGLLRAIGFPQEKIPAVLQAIETHQPKDEPQSIEAAILRDADILEQLGAMGVLRTVCKVGRDTRYPTFTPAVEALERALATLPGAIRLPMTRQLAEPRIALLHAFLAAVRAEAAGMLY